MEDKTIQTAAANTILQNSIGKVTIGDITYEIEPPTTGTLIMVSALVSELPEIDPETPKEKYISTLINAAGECGTLGQIAATIILGAKRIKNHPTTIIRTYEFIKRWSWRKFKFIKVSQPVETPIYERDYIADQILDNMTMREIKDFIDHALSEAHLADFFVLTTSLRTKSLLNPTREVEKTIASGHLSEAGLNIGN